MRFSPLPFAAALLFSMPAAAQIAPECAGVQVPTDYDEQIQQDFLANYVGLAASFSPAHGPVPHEPGHGMIGVGVNVMPPLNCQRRLVLNGSKTEDTNKTPAIPMPRFSVALPQVGPITIYVGGGYLPPVPAFGARTTILAAEIGAGMELDSGVQVGARLHAMSFKTVADVATAFVATDPPVDDLFLANTIGADLMGGYAMEKLTPYVAVGWTDVSTFFFVGDDAYVANNYHPYSGLSFSVGADTLVKEHLRVGAEFYGAPGGYADPDSSTAVPLNGRSAGQIYTGRVRLGVEL